MAPGSDPEEAGAADEQAAAERASPAEPRRGEVTDAVGTIGSTADAGSTDTAEPLPPTAATPDTAVQDHRPRLWPLFGAVALVGLGLDIATKVEAVDRLEPNLPVRVLGPLLSLRLIRNPGAAFSQGEGFAWVFAVAALLVVAFVLVRLVPRLGHVGWAVALGLLVGGVTGNLLDRLFRTPGPFRGHVVDFLQLPHWPIFNVADMCITAAAVMVVVLSILKNVGIDGRRPGEDGTGRRGAGRAEDSSTAGAEAPPA